MTTKFDKIESIVAKAIVLQNEIEERKIVLEECKILLRERAKTDTKNGEKVVYSCHAGSAEVVFVSPRPKLKAGANPYVLKEPLGEMTWRDLFLEEIKVSLTKDYNKRVLLLPDEQRTQVVKIVNVETPEPQVTLKPTKRL